MSPDIMTESRACAGCTLHFFSLKYFIGDLLDLWGLEASLIPMTSFGLDRPVDLLAGNELSEDALESFKNLVSEDIFTIKIWKK